MPRIGPEHEDYRPRGPVILGFPLGDLSFGAFSSKKMFDARWHLRPQRFGASPLSLIVRRDGRARRADSTDPLAQSPISSPC